MRFRQLDSIRLVVPGSRLEAVKRLVGDEDYLRDHFPRFPVLPGVLMLEAMFQAAAWLVRVTDDFAHAGVVLKEARNVKFAEFVAPGEELVVTATLVKHDATLATLKTDGMLGDRTAVSARLMLESFAIADRCPTRGTVDPWTRRTMRLEYERLCQAARTAPWRQAG